MRKKNWEKGLMQQTAENENKTTAAENPAQHTYCSQGWHGILLNVHMLYLSRREAATLHCLHPQTESVQTRQFFKQKQQIPNTTD